MTPNPELLRAEFLGVTLRHDELRRDREDTALLLARDGERYGLNRLEFGDDDSGTLTGPNGSELVLRPTQTACGATTSLGFGEGLARVMGLLADGLGAHDSERLWIDDLTLIAVWDTETPDGARRCLTEDILVLDDERRDLLGGDDAEASHGLRVWRRLGDGTLDAAVEPMHADLSRMYLRPVYAQEDPLRGLHDVEDCAHALNDYLHGPLAAFVQARAPR